MPIDKKKLVCEEGYKLVDGYCITSFTSHGDTNPDSCTSTLVIGDNTVTCSHPAKPQADDDSGYRERGR